ncbi:MAG: AzlC family ABC transporter permease [Actinomycetota bacterium]
MAVTELRRGIVSVAPLIPGVVPFGMVSGAAVVDAGHGMGEALGLSVVLFAGASQLAVLDVLGQGAGVAVAIASAWIINLRFLLYSTALAVHLDGLSVSRRLGMGYVLTDQAYAVAAVGAEERSTTDTFWRFLGAAWTMWASWQVSTILGVVVGDRVPEDVPIDFVIPLLFLSIVLPALVDRPTVLAAVVGGVGAVTAAEAGAGDLSLMTGALLGIVAGTLADRGEE